MADRSSRSCAALMALPDTSVEDFLAHHCHEERFDCDLLEAIANANVKWGAQTGLGHAQTIGKWLSLTPIERAAALPELRKVVLTEKDTLRVSSGQEKAEPHYEAQAGRLAVLIGELLAVQNGVRLAADMAAGLRAGQAFAAAYTRAKRSAGVADFNDLIAWTRRLLATPGMGDWVRYKLDRRTDHILVDESQDTNREQWEIVQALAEEFFAGASAAERRGRTIFMVGDFKQAIFGFQGTDPHEFKRARDWVRQQSAALLEADEDARAGAALEFRDLSIEASYRSAPAILEVVDAVIADVDYRNMGLPERSNPHRAHFYSRPGVVELWKPFAAPDVEEADPGEEGWLEEDARLYAGALAKQVRRWLDEAAVLASTKRPISAGDVLILLRSRGELASLIVARLFEEGVPVAGIDRLHLQEPLAVKDLLAAVAFAAQPLDDLNLANLLVSPLVGWSQELLLELAYGRGGTPLWQRLGERADARPEFRETRDQLNALLAMADYTTPHRYLETILSGPMKGRRKLYGRLGMAARDPIDELLASALEFENQETPSLDRFLAWFARGDVEIKRDPSAPANAVRVMTVHGAKGLEAPIVILADATADPARLGGVSRTLDFPIAGVGEVPLIRPRKAERMTPFSEAHCRGRGARPAGALAVALCRNDPGRGAAGHCRLETEDKGRCASRKLLAPERRARARLARREPGRRSGLGYVASLPGRRRAGGNPGEAAASHADAVGDPGLVGAPGASRIAASAALGAVGDHCRHGGIAAAERGTTRRSRTRHVDPPASRAPRRGGGRCKALDRAALAGTVGRVRQRRWTERKLPTPYVRCSKTRVFRLCSDPARLPKRRSQRPWRTEGWLREQSTGCWSSQSAFRSSTSRPAECRTRMPQFRHRTRRR